jgi:excisionase family DNA binding protein
VATTLLTADAQGDDAGGRWWSVIDDARVVDDASSTDDTGRVERHRSGYRMRGEWLPRTHWEVTMSAVTQARTRQMPGPQGRQERTHGPTEDRDEKLLLSVVEAARRLGIGRTLMYELLRSGQMPSVRLGRLRKVPSEAVEEFVSELRRGERAE